jgi:hypothetical protein
MFNRYGLDVQQIWVGFLAGERFLFLFHIVHTVSDSITTAFSDRNVVELEDLRLPPRLN